MRNWMLVLAVVLLLASSAFIGHLVWPRVVNNTNTVTQTVTEHVPVSDTAPLAVLRDSVAHLLKKLNAAVPLPPVPQYPQEEMMYGLSFVKLNDGHELTASLFTGAGEPMFEQRTWSKLDENFWIAYEPSTEEWQVASWGSTSDTVASPRPVVTRKWRAWRLTGSAAAVWYPGHDVVVSVSPGILVLGHLAVTAEGRIGLKSIVDKDWSSLGLGVGVALRF